MLLVLFHHLPRLIQRIIAVAHDVDQPLVQRLVWVVVLYLDALLPVLQPEKVGCLLHYTSHHVEMVGVQSARLCSLVQLDQRCQVMQERLAGRVLKDIAVRRRALLKEVPVRLVFSSLHRTLKNST